MTAADSGAAGPRERRKRTVAFVALPACVALLACAVACRASLLRAAPVAVQPLSPGECSCDVRARFCAARVGTRMSATHAMRRRRRTPHRLRRLCLTCAARCVRAVPPASGDPPSSSAGPAGADRHRGRLLLRLRDGGQTERGAALLRGGLPPPASWLCAPFPRGLTPKSVPPGSAEPAAHPADGAAVLPLFQGQPVLRLPFLVRGLLPPHI